jgi:flagellar basal body rod protein FlgG
MNPLYLAASGAASQLAQLDVPSSNLANASTPGYRRFLNVIEAVSGNGTPYEYATPQASPSLDLMQGPINATGNPLDVAVTGPDFITVQTPNGPAYTRNGALQVATDGTLLAAGQPVLSGGGDSPIKLPPGAISIASDGSITVAGKPVGQIALADSSGVTMVARGASLYAAADDSEVSPATGGSLREGFLEASTGNPIDSITSMIDAMRSYQATMNSVKSIDQNDNQAIQAFTLQA